MQITVSKHCKKIIPYLCILFTPIIIYASSPEIIDRGNNWTFNDTNTTTSGTPSKLKFLKYFDVLPDQITMQILNKRNLSNFVGKHIFVGYGVVNPNGKNCRIFPSSLTGMDHNVTICLPWWRIEREYEKSSNPIDDINNILCQMPKPKPPIMVKVCKKWDNSGNTNYPGGKVTCTSYYDRLISTDCWDNPKQPKCFKDNCSNYIKKHCTDKGDMMGNVTSLPTAKKLGNIISPVDTKIGLVTHQYDCPAGSMVPFTKCEESKSVLMYPYECSPRTKGSTYDDSVYIYCNENEPQYDTSGNILGFLGKCPDGRQVMCHVDSFSETTNKCIEPIMKTETKTTLKETVDLRNYTEHEVDVLSGEPDIYSANPNCVRSNTISQARDHKVYAHIVGDGYLDDDIYVIKHHTDSSFTKIYCNMQHAENYGSTKPYDGSVMKCIDNNGDYAFNKIVEIKASDIVSVQEATENENSYRNMYFPTGRTNYRSTKVTIDDILVAPQALISNFPYYPEDGPYLKLWENSLGTLSILFPYAGAYELYFFDKNNELVAKASINMDDFKNMGSAGNINLKLAHTMQLAPGFTKGDPKNCLDDDWTEIGGGIYGNKNKEGQVCKSPDDNYVKTHAIMKVIVKDLMTGNIVTIPLVYPLAYPNRVFISKLKLYEKRKYRCYEPFPTR